MESVLKSNEESTQQTFVLMKTSSRRLDQDEYICWSHTSLKSSRRHLEDVLVKTNIFVLAIRLHGAFKSCKNVFKTSSRGLAKMFSRRFQDVSSTVLVNKSSRRIQYCKEDLLQKDLPSEKFMVSVNICKSDKNFSRFSFSLYCTF